MSISVQNISKRYGEQWALDNVSFEINRGEIVGFIGPNGAGKSTTMKIITGYIPPSSGNVSVNGLHIREEAMEIKRILGYLPESNPLYPEMYVREYLKYAAGLYGIKGKEASAKVNNTIELVGLGREAHKKIASLSKGYKQRVGLGQALIHDPEILILDEPTSGLDPNQIIEIRNLISEVGKEKTVMLSTHIMQEVEAICHRVIIIDRGKIKADEKATSIGKETNSIQTIQIELETPVEKHIWEELDFISEVRQIDEKTYLLATTSHEDIRSGVFQFAVEKKFTILSMNRKEKSLEEVFREVTSGEK